MTVFEVYAFIQDGIHYDRQAVNDTGTS